MSRVVEPGRATPVEALRGFRIGVTSDRRSADLIAALERRGAQVLHAPALTIAPNDEDGALVGETRELIAARPEVVLVTTGYGMRRWFEVADAAGLGAELTAALESARIFARGPKAHGAVRAAGLLDAQTTELDTTASLVDAVIAEGLLDTTVAIQLHGFTDEVQLRRLREVSRTVLTVTPYRWLRPSTPERLGRLIRAATQHQLDAVTFTSAPVGPVTAEPLRSAGIEVAVPDRYRLGALIRLVTDELSAHHVRRFRTSDLLVEMRGRNVSLNGRSVTLGPNALALFSTLTASPTVVSRQELIDALPDDLDDHALEVAMSRLRRTLDAPGLITTVVKRGYRFNATRVA
jgi:uroporphyrinogen-III synthase